MTQLEGFVEKGWGHENIFATNEKYCGKLLVFKRGAKSSMHFHMVKDETWYVHSGRFKLVTIDMRDSSRTEVILEAGSVVRLVPMVPHQVTCLRGGTIFEVSTPDSVEDNYRIAPGDSQR